jgi:hypothetical protein
VTYHRYAKYVQRALSRAEILLKLLLSPHYPPESLVNNYIALTGDTQLHHFQRTLELKGLKRAEQQVLLDHFQRILLSGRPEAPKAVTMPSSSSSSPQKTDVVSPAVSSSTLFTNAGQEFTKASQLINENLRKLVLTMKRSG